MRRKKFHRRKTFKEKLVEKAYTYFIMAIVILFLFVSLNKLTKSNIISIEKIKTDIKKVGEIIKKVEPRITGRKTPKPVNVKKITRSEAYKRGMDIVNFVWTYNYKLNGLRKNQDAELPNYLEGVKQVKIAGLPYCWGGFTSLDTSSQSGIKTFSEAIKEGYTAGNVKCTGGYKSFTAGLDCSGFVCAVFKIPEKRDTGSLDKYFDEISIKDLKPMDILNCVNKHVFIYLGETADKRAIITMEASYNVLVKNSERTKINFRTWASVKKGMDGKAFVPMRYRGIIDDSVPVFKDSSEFSSVKDYAGVVGLKGQFKGYIDYADDIDDFKINILKGTKYYLDIINNKQDYNFTVSDLNDRAILHFNTQGMHFLRLPEGSYYIKVSARDFKYNPDEMYSFSIKDSLNPNLKKQTVKKSLQNAKARNIKRPAQVPVKNKASGSTEKPAKKFTTEPVKKSKKQLPVTATKKS